MNPTQRLVSACLIPLGLAIAGCGGSKAATSTAAPVPEVTVVTLVQPFPSWTACSPSPTVEELAAWVKASLRSTKTPETWEFRAEADEATVAKPGYPECVAMLVQIGDHLSKQYDFKG